MYRMGKREIRAGQSDRSVARGQEREEGDRATERYRVGKRESREIERQRENDRKGAMLVRFVYRCTRSVGCGRATHRETRQPANGGNRRPKTGQYMCSRGHLSSHMG